MMENLILPFAETDGFQLKASDQVLVASNMSWLERIHEQKVFIYKGIEQQLSLIVKME